MRKALGRYVVVDSSICHGQPTFRGTRILVKDVLEQVAGGLTWGGNCRGVARCRLEGRDCRGRSPSEQGPGGAQ